MDELAEILGGQAGAQTDVEAMGSDQPMAENEDRQDEEGLETVDLNGEGTGEDTGAADRPNGQADRPTLTQKQFDRAFGERAAGLRKQFEREHAAEISLAGRLRSRYPGLTDDEIAAKIDEAEAKDLAEKTGWTEPEALKRVQARREYEKQTVPAEQTEPEADEHLTMLQQQRQQIMERSGVDVVEYLREDAYLREQVNSKKMDLKDVYSYVLENRANTHTKPTRPPVDTRRTSQRVQPGSLTDEEFEKADRLLQQGVHVRL